VIHLSDYTDYFFFRLFSVHFEAGFDVSTCILNPRLAG